MEASRELPKVPRSLPCSASIQRVSAASDAPCGSGGLKSTITGPVPSDASAARLRSRSSTASALLCPNPNSESLQRSFSSRHCTREASSVASHAHVSNTDVNSGADSSERQRPAQDRSARGRSSGVSKLPAIACEASGSRKLETPPRRAKSESPHNLSLGFRSRRLRNFAFHSHSVCKTVDKSRPMRKLRGTIGARSH